jgi:hypothetical protein
MHFYSEEQRVNGEVTELTHDHTFILGEKNFMEPDQTFK